ncbi:MAG: recombinase family protein, partial [Gammaproteobacteria bacterium]|nr:recombinase family protein [Gammaproteobacteria bacterium]
RLRNSANTLDVMERQRIVRLVVKDVLIGDDTLVIRHCIPIVALSPSGGAPPAAGNAGGTPNSQNYLLRKGSGIASSGSPESGSQKLDGMVPMSGALPAVGACNALFERSELHVEIHSVSSFEAHQSRVNRHVGVLSPAPHLFARVPKHACEDVQKRRIELPARLKLEISERCGPSDS